MRSEGSTDTLFRLDETSLSQTLFVHSLVALFKQMLNAQREIQVLKALVDTDFADIESESQAGDLEAALQAKNRRYCGSHFIKANSTFESDSGH